MNKLAQPIQMEQRIVVMTPAEVRELMRSTLAEARAEDRAEAKRLAALEQSEQPHLLTRQQAADLLGVSKGSIDNYVRDGLLTKRKIGTHSVRIDREEIEKLARRV